MNRIIKIALSIIILIYAIYPYITKTNYPDTFEYVFSLGIIGSASITITFFTAIGFYCMDLQRCLELIAPKNRKTNPKSIWYMFLIPYNFIEDFFIIIDISNSLELEAKENKKLQNYKNFGMVTGIGWCIAQVLCFIPNITGQAASILGLVLWIIHWRFIIKINKQLIRN
jgi:hypothetical protein